MQFIDTHAHMYDEQFLENIDEFVQKAEAEFVHQIYLPNCDQHTIAPMMDICKQYPGVFKPMMGLHPCYVKEDYETELKIVADWLAKEKFAAIGEIGLDFYWDKTFAEQQIKAFEYQTRLALDYNLPIIIHTRSSTDEAIALLKTLQNGNLKGIFHCFGGTSEQAQQIIDLGFLMGIGGVVTFKKSELPEVLKNVPLSHLVLETDAPYLAPMPFRGKQNQSAYIPYIAEKIAQIKALSIEEVARVTTANAQQLFKF